MSGGWAQVSRLSNPLVNEVVIGLPDKDKFNASEPKNDAQFAAYVTNPTLPALLDVLFRDAVNATLGTSFPNIAPSNLPRIDLVTAFLTGFNGVNQQAIVTPSEMVRLNTAIAATPAAQQSTFGVAGGDLAGFPNGRRPGDDVVDLALRVVMGRLCHPLTIGGNPVDLGLCTPENAPVGTRAVHRRCTGQRRGLRHGVPVPQDAVPGIRKLSPWACAPLPAGRRRSRHGPRPSSFSLPSPAPRRPSRYRPADGDAVVLALPAGVSAAQAMPADAGGPGTRRHRCRGIPAARAHDARRALLRPRRGARRALDRDGRRDAPAARRRGRPRTAAP